MKLHSLKSQQVGGFFNITTVRMKCETWGSSDVGLRVPIRTNVCHCLYGSIDLFTAWY